MKTLLLLSFISLFVLSSLAKAHPGHGEAAHIHSFEFSIWLVLGVLAVAAMLSIVYKNSKR